MRIFPNLKLFNRKSKDNEEKEIAYGRYSTVSNAMQRITPQNSRTINLLEQLQNTTNLIDAIQLIVDETPDGKMAHNIYLRLANQGFNVEWHRNNTGRIVKKYDSEFRDFCSRMGANNASGIDGIVDQLHSSSLVRGGMGVEVVVEKGATDIQEIAIIDPATIEEFEWDDSLQRYKIFQQQSSGKKVDLMEGNFFWKPHAPKPGHPDGTLQFAPAVMATIYYLQLLEDSTNVLSRIAFPRYDFSIDRAAFLESLADKSKKGQREQMERLFADIKRAARDLKYDNDFIHFDDTKVGVIGGGVNGTGIDVRAWFEVLDPVIINAFQLTPVLMGRLSSGSYSLGSVEFKIVTDTVDSMRRDSKRILEEVFKIWARVKGYDVYPVVTYNPIDWEKELDKINAQLKNVELYRRYQEYGYIDGDTAAMNTAGVEKAVSNDLNGMYEFIKKRFLENGTTDSGEGESVTETAEQADNDTNSNEQEVDTNEQTEEKSKT